jgi:hypothetical protein
MPSDQQSNCQKINGLIPIFTGSFETGWRTLQGYEVMHMIRKGQVQGVEKGNCRGQIMFIASLFGVAA